MFTGIIESFGKVVQLEAEQDNIQLTIESSISDELKVDQSIAHNGVCLTVVAKKAGQHKVTAIKETLLKSNFQYLKEGDLINLERAMRADARLDGHFVQGHVDQTATCVRIEESNGSWYYHFQYNNQSGQVLIEKGSICINGVSLTLVEATDQTFSVAIIPYTYQHTNFHQFKVGTIVNIEFDMMGKYITKLFQQHYQKA